MRIFRRGQCRSHPATIVSAPRIRHRTDRVDPQTRFQPFPPQRAVMPNRRYLCSSVRAVTVFRVFTANSLSLPRGAYLAEELLVRSGGLLKQQLKRVLAVQHGERAAEADDGGMLGGIHQQVLTAGAGR